MTPAHAVDVIEPLAEILDTPGSAGLGLVTQSSASPYRDGGRRYDLIPLYLYEGERLFLHANRGGIKLRKNADHRIDLFVEQRLEGFPADRLPASLAGMTQRDSGLDLGLGLRNRQSWGTLSAEFVHDIGGTSKGSEARFGYSYDWSSGPWTLKPSLSFAVRDARLNNYYYGVQASEAAEGGRPTRPAQASTPPWVCMALTT